jgi:hypothetical protein
MVQGLSSLEMGGGGVGLSFNPINQMLQLILKLIQGPEMIILPKVHSPDGGKMVVPFE